MSECVRACARLMQNTHKYAYVKTDMMRATQKLLSPISARISDLNDGVRLSVHKLHMMSLYSFVE